LTHRTQVIIGHSALAGVLAIPEAADGLVIFAHGSGSSRFSVRNRAAADALGQSGFATLLFDLLTEAEASDRRNVFDIPLLGARVVEAIDWAGADPRTLALPIGLFGASTGAAAAIVAAVARADAVAAIVSRGGRPDLAGAALRAVRAPALMIVGGEDRQVLALNTSAMKAMHCKTFLTIVPGAGHLFEEEGTLDQALTAAADWFGKHLRSQRPLFDDRTMAGRALAAKISRRAPVKPVVYALPRGGVPVALEIAEVLKAPLDLLLVRKIGVPWHLEFAAGAVVDGEEPDIILNPEIMRAAGLAEAEVTARGKAQLPEIERRRSLYMPGLRPVAARGRTAILVDDGIATGASMSAAIAAIRRREPQSIVVAVPVMSRNSVLALHEIVDEIVCLAAPDNFRGVGEFYRDFHQLSDEEVVGLLAQYAQAQSRRQAEETSAPLG